jgi:hypothetical protein
VISDDGSFKEPDAFHSVSLKGFHESRYLAHHSQWSPMLVPLQT